MDRSRPSTNVTCIYQSLSQFPSLSIIFTGSFMSATAGISLAWPSLKFEMPCNSANTEAMDQNRPLSSICHRQHYRWHVSTINSIPKLLFITRSFGVPIIKLNLIIISYRRPNHMEMACRLACMLTHL
jgi:hypothetical protein